MSRSSLIKPLLTLLLVHFIAVAPAQDRQSIRLKNVSLSDAITKIAKLYHVQIAFNTSLTNNIKVNTAINDKTLEEALSTILKDTNIQLERVDKNAYILVEKVKPKPKIIPDKKKKYTLSGYVTQHGSSEKLIAASVAVMGKPQGCITNEFGFYSLTLDEGEYDIMYTYVGYQPLVLRINLTGNTVQNTILKSGHQLQEVVVRSSKDNDIHIRPQVGFNSLSMDYVKSAPVLLGEADILKTIQLLPGVKAGNEGSAGVYVRGGSPDQNLILLDGVPIYNASHMLGFFSVFNADAINSTQLYKGGFPARYGERLSSVIDVRMKEGNMEKYEGEIAVGLISSKINVSGPIFKDKTSFILSARRTYTDLLIKGAILLSDAKDDNGNSAEMPDIYFYDINAKVNHKFSDKDRLYLSFYRGGDVLGVTTNEAFTNNSYSDNARTDIGISWGNSIAALRWNHIFSPKLFGNLTATSSKYAFKVFFERETISTPIQDKVSYGFQSLRFKSGIDDFSTKLDFDYIPSTIHTIKFGGAYTFHTFTPNASEIVLKEKPDQTTENEATYRSKEAHEAAAYIEDLYEIAPKLKMNAGLRASLFYVDGITYKSVEPRLLLSYQTTETSSLKFAYVEMNQYLHFLSSGSLALPSDLWVPTTKKVEPQRSRQVSLGMTKSLGPTVLSLEAYYKTMNKIIEYKDGASFNISDTTWEEKVVMGKGESYGLEALLEKKSGRLTGWIGYTLSWAYRKFNEFNNGQKYPFTYDRRHDISITACYKFSPRFDIGATWVYSTGRAFTLANEVYTPYTSDIRQSSDNASNFSNRNNIRLPNYHRLDLGVNFHKKKKWGERTWSLGLYNAYLNHNTFFVYPSEGKLRSVGLFMFVPSLTYSYKF